MTDRFIFTKHPATCYNCGSPAAQIIKAVSTQAQVICSHCGATRIFIPRVVKIGEKGTYTPIGCYDVWELESDAPCKNCGLTGSHDLVIGCNHFTTRCRNCGYTHFYKFSLEYIAQCPIDESDEG
jgi:uncharacterized Zn finger protein